MLGCLLTVPIHASKCGASWRVEDCSEFASSFQKIGHTDVTILNSSYTRENAVNISGTLNAVPVCRLFGNVPYAGNNSVIFELWLPSTEKYNGRFLVVGMRIALPLPVDKRSHANICHRQRRHGRHYC